MLVEDRLVLPVVPGAGVQFVVGRQDVYPPIGPCEPVPHVTEIVVREVGQQRAVAGTATTWITADGSTVSLAVSLLAEKLEIELSD